MTQEELKTIVSEVITELQKQGVEIDATNEAGALAAVDYMLATSGDAMARVAPEVVNAGEKELLKRLRGTSDDSNSRLDPFKHLGPDTDEGYSFEDFNTALNGLLFDNSVVGYNQGFFRARVRWCEVEIQNIVLSNSASNMIIVQIVKGAIKADSTNERIIKDDSGDYTILYRQYKDSAWGGWKEAYQENLVSGTNIKTINGQSILGEGNIEITTEGGGITSESDPIFKASAAAGITADDIEAWNNKSDFSGSYNNLTDKPVIPSIEGLVTTEQLAEKQDAITDLDEIRSDAKKGATAVQGVQINDSPIRQPESGIINLEFKTINGESIEGSGNIDLSGYVTEAELATTKEGLETKINSQDQEIEDLGKSAIRTIQIYGSSFAPDPEDDGFVLLPFKTINGQSILGEGNIEITTEGGGITAESDPIFKASAAAGITDEDIASWNSKSDFSGSYEDLTDKPTIPAEQVNADWNATSGKAQIINKPAIPSIEGLVTTEQLAEKQDVITDLESIRLGSSKGAVSLQYSEVSEEIDDVETVGSAVKYEPQNLSESQKAQARANIGAASTEELQRMYNELLALIQGGVVTPSYAILDQAILDQVILS